MSEIPGLFEAACARVVRERLNRYGDYGRIETIEEVSVPGLAPEPGSAAEQLALRLSRHNRTISVPYATEAGRFQGRAFQRWCADRARSTRRISRTSTSPSIS